MSGKLKKRKQYKQYIVWCMIPLTAVGESAEQVRRDYKTKGYDVRSVEEDKSSNGLTAAEKGLYE